MKQRPAARPRLLVEELERRILYSADAAALLGLSGAIQGAEVRLLEPLATVPPVVQPSATAQQESAREIVFIDSRVPDAMKLADQLMQQRGGDRVFDIVTLDADEDGIGQIDRILASEHDLAAIHIISHGSDGAIQIGSTDLDAARLAIDAEAVAQWGKSLAKGGDLLLYGCNVAQDAAGQAFVQSLARLTGADVTASTDLTGSASIGGNWTLEFATGTIHTQFTPSTFERLQWDGVLATYTVTNTNDTGAGSLRDALAQANASVGVADIIAFSIGSGAQTIALGSTLTISDQVTINGWSQTGFAGTPLIRIDGSLAGFDGLAMTGTSDGSVIQGLVITRFRDGIITQAGADNITIKGNWIGTTGTGTGNAGRNTDDGLDLTGDNAIIGGTGANDRNVITNNADEGITSVAAGLVIKGNYIGVDPDGATGGGNVDVGIALFTGTGNTIGGVTAAERNVISMNNEGIEINSSNNVIQGNYIGTDAGGTLNRGNRIGNGVQVQGGSTGNTIGGSALGAGNLIAYSASNGVDIVNGSANAVLGNTIHSNTLLGINLGTAGVTANDAGDGDSGANNLQNFPVLVSAVTNGTQLIVAGSLNSTANSFFRIELFASASADGTGYGEGQTYLGFVNVTTDGSGNATINTTLTASVAAGSFISATATNSNAAFTTFTNTSEFALNTVAATANTAPTLGNGTLAAVAEDTGSPAGQTVSAIFSGQFADIDAGSSFGGIAVVGNTANAGTQGTWQYSSNGGTNWFAIGTVADGATALTVSSASLIRFVPVANYNGTPPALTVRGLDNTYAGGFSTTAGSETRVNVNTTTNGGATAIAAVTATLATSINPVADTPSVTNATTNEDTQSTTGLVITRSAADGAEVTHFQITGITSGTLYKNNGTTQITNGDFITFAEGNAGLKFTPTANFNGSGSFTVQASTTNGAGGLGGSTVNATITVNPVNDAPTATNLNAAQAYTEDTPLALTAIVASDVDSASITATLTLSDVAAGSLNTGTSGAVTSTFVAGVWSASGAVADVNTLLAGLTFAPSLNYNANFSIATSVSDGVAAPVTGSKTMTGTPVNDAPTATNLNAGQTYTEDTPLSLTAIVISDVDSASITATLTLSNVAAGSLNTGTSGAVTSTYNAGTGVWSASGATANVNALLAGLTFTPTADFNANFTIATSVSDGVAAPITGTKNMTGTPVNDAPVLSAGGGTLVYTENDASTAVDAALILSDADNVNLSGASVSISANYVNGQDQLAFTNQNGITGSWDAAAGVLTLSGSATVAQYEAALRSVTYANASDAPSTAVRTVSFVVSDGVSSSNTASRNVAVSAVNDAPVAADDRLGVNFDGVDDYVSVPSSASLVMSTTLTMESWVNPDTSASGPQIILNKEGEYEMAIFADGSLNFAIAEGGVWNWHNTGAIIARNAWTHVALTYDAGVVTTYVNGVSVDTQSLLTTTIDDVYPGLNELRIGGRSNNPAGQYFDGRIADVRVWNVVRSQPQIAGAMNSTLTGAESGLAGCWTLDDNSGVVAADKTANGNTGTLVNGAAWAGYRIDEDTVLNAAVPGVLGNDYDADGDPLTVVLVAGPAHGSLTVNANGSFVYTPDADWNGTDSFTYRANDGGADSNVASVVIKVNPINDAPIATNLNAAETYTEDTALNLTDIVVSDVDSASITATLTLSNASAGSLNTGTSGAVTSTYNAGTGVWTASGATADVNALLAALTFTPTADFNSNFTIATSVSDGVAAPVTGSKAMTGTPVNDAPTATNMNAAQTYTEDTPLALTTIVASDVDSANLTVTLTLSDVAAGSLNTGTAGAVTSTYNVGTGVWTASGATADVNALLAALTFTPTANFNDNFTIATSVSDGSLSVSGSKAMTGTPVNNAPTATNLSAAETYTEDTALNLTDIVVSDVDSANVTVTLTLSDVTAGSLNTGTAGAVTSTFVAGVWSASGAVADVNTLLAGLTFAPSLNYNANFSIATSVSDGVAAPITGSKTMTGAAVNDAPVVATTGTNLAYTENAAATAIDPVLTVSDVDSANLTGATVTISANYANGQDVLAFTNQLGITGTWNAGTGVLTLSGAASVADYQTALRSVTYVNSSDDPSALSRTISIVVDDGGLPSLAATRGITVSAVNDAPVVFAPAAISVLEDSPSAIAGIVLYDVDAGGGSVTATFTAASGSLFASSGGGVVVGGNASALTLTGTIANLNTFIGANSLSFTTALNDTSAVTLGVSLNDGGNTGSGGPLSSGVTNVTLNVTPVNDAPSATNLSAPETYTEDTALNLTDIVISDVDGGSVTATLILSDALAGSLNTGTSGAVTSTYNAGTGAWTASGAIADVNALLAGLTFTPSLNYNANFSIATSVSDGVAAPVTGTKNMTGTPVNDAPTTTNLSAAETYTENTALNLTDIVVSDVDSANVTATLTLSNTAAGSLNTATSGAVASTYNAGTGVWSASGATADVNALLAALTFTPTVNFNSSFTITTSVNDGSLSVTGSKAMTGTAVNDAPTATNLNAAQTYTEDTPLALTAIVASDIDSANVTATLTLSNTAAGSLNTATSGAVTSTYNTGSGVWSASGALADVNALLAGLTFTPTADFNANFTIATSVSDGSLSASGSKAITGIAVNDAPVATITPATYAATEQVALTLKNTGLSISDVDAAAGAMTVTLSVTEGTLTVTAGGSGALVSNSGTSSVTITGTVTQINNLLSSDATSTVSYIDNTDAPSASATLILQVNDNGNTGGGALTNSDTAAINITAVNDAPVLAAIGNQSVNEGATLSFTASGTDPDLPSQTLSYSLDAASLALGMTINSSTGAFSWTPSEAQGGLAPSVTITVTDNGTGNLTDSETFTITVGDTNLAPVLAAIGNQAVNEGSTLSFTASATDADLPSQMLTYSLDAASLALGMTINSSTGAFSWAPSEAQGGFAPSVTVTVTDNGTGNLTDSETFTVTVGDTNLAPVLAAIGNQSVNEGATLSFTASATDPDLPAQTLSYSLDAASLALGMTINSSTGAFSWTPSEAQGGAAPSVIVTVTDNGTGNLTDSETFTITVGDINLAPVLAAIGNQTVNEGATLSFTATATDADLPSQTLTYSLDAASLALGMTIDANTGAFSWTPNGAQGGTTPSVTITVTDNGTGNLNDSETFTISVGEVNTAPLLAAIGNQSVAEGVTLSFTASATDADVPAQSLSYSLDAASLALGMTINSSTGAFSWTPSEAQGGLAPSVTITVTDSGTGNLTDSETLTITVADLNDAPVLAAIGNQAVNEGATLSFTATATDADLPSQTLTYSLDAASLALGMTIDANTGAFSWTPNGAQGGTTPSVTITVTDNGTGSLTDSETFTIGVGEVNTAPVLAAIGKQSVNEGATLSFTASATDADMPSQTLTYSLDAASLALGMTIDSATGAFSWTPTLAQGGLTPSVTVTVTDNGTGNLTDSHTFTITVAAVNNAPVTAPVTLIAIAEDSSARLITQAELLANATDVDGPSLNATGLAIASGSGTLVDNGNGTWTYTPALNDDTSASFSYTVTDGSLTATGSATLDITPLNDAPVLATASLSLQAGQALVLGSGQLRAADTDSAPSTLLFEVSNVSAGRFELVAGPGAPITQFSQAQVAQGDVRFVQTNAAQLPSFDVTVFDGSARSATLSVVASVAQPPAPAPAPAEAPAPAVATPPAITKDASAGAQAPVAVATSDADNAVQGPATSGARGRVGGGSAEAATSLGLNTTQAAYQAASTAPRGAALPPPDTRAAADPRVKSLFDFNLTVAFDGYLQQVADSPLMAALQSAAVDLRSGLTAEPARGGPDPDAHDDTSPRITVEVAQATGLALSVGAVWWALRAGGLLASLIGTLPTWRHVDLLAVLPDEEDDRNWDVDGDDEARRDEQAVDELMASASERDS